MEKCNADADTTLITVCLSSSLMYFGCDAHLVLLGNNASLLSAFIIAIHTQLQPGCTQLRYDVLWMVAKSEGLNVPEKPSSGPRGLAPIPTTSWPKS